jgi:pimeloyl-ACP methyl ester carboxylesterase
MSHPFLIPLVLFFTCLASVPARALETTNRPAPAREKLTYVIVHGAWGGGWAFKEVDRRLSADGHKVYRPTLTGQGERSHLASTNLDLSLHIQDIVNVILWEDLHDVVLVGHSYGGMVITGVADRVPDRIKQMIYLDALLPNDGECANDIRTNMGLDQPVKDGFIMPVWIKGNEPLPHDVPQPAKTWSEKISLKHQDRAQKLPTTYILTVDAGKPPKADNFYKFYERAKSRGWTLLILEGDHNVQWSHPKELVELLEHAP